MGKGRNGIYIEPDLEYIEIYKKEGVIVNCAADGKCGYTSRQELAFAYFNLLTNDSLLGKTYNLFGEPITQHQLTKSINKAFNTNLEFKSISVDNYIKQRQASLGEFIGTVIGGIYEGIKNGKFDGESNFSDVTKRRHKSIDEIINEYIINNSHVNV